MYDAGGPGKWTCSQLVAWTLAFAGGLNTDYQNPYDTCKNGQPGWVIQDIQECPGRLMEEDNIWDPAITWSMPCNGVACWIGAPPSWVGGHPPLAGGPAPVAATPAAATPAPSSVA